MAPLPPPICNVDLCQSAFWANVGVYYAVPGTPWGFAPTLNSGVRGFGRKCGRNSAWAFISQTPVRDFFHVASKQLHLMSGRSFSFTRRWPPRVRQPIPLYAVTAPFCPAALPFPLHINIHSPLGHRTANIQSTCSQHTVNIQSTYSQHTVNIQSTYSQHTINIQST